MALSIWSGDNFEDLKECFDSLVNQTFNFFDVVVVVDGPVSDEVLNLVNSTSFKVIMKTTNTGLAESLNMIIENTEHEFIARMDADDKCEPDRLEKQFEFMINNNHVDVCGCAVKIFGDGDGFRHYPSSHEACFQYFRFRDPISHPTAFFRRRFFEKVGLYDVRLNKDQDTDLWARAFEKGAVLANLQAVLLQFRVTNAQMARRRHTNRIFRYASMRWKINKKLNYGYFSQLYLLLYLCLMLIPSDIKILIIKLSYKKFWFSTKTNIGLTK